MIGIQEYVNKKREQSHVTIREFKIIEELTDISSQIIIFRSRILWEKDKCFFPDWNYQQIIFFEVKSLWTLL